MPQIAEACISVRLEIRYLAQSFLGPLLLLLLLIVIAMTLSWISE